MMKRKVGIFLIVGITFLSTFGGGGAMLVTGPNLTEIEPSVQIQQNHTEQTPSAIARKSRGGRGGRADNNEDKDEDKDEGEASQLQLGNSWGG